MYSMWDPQNKSPLGEDRTLSAEYEEFLNLYYRGALAYPDLNDLLTRWLAELSKEGFSSDWQKQSREHNARGWMGEARAVQLENGETLWVRMDTLRLGGVQVLDQYLRTDQAILAALTVLEVSEASTIPLSDALLNVADAMRRGERFKALPWQGNILPWPPPVYRAGRLQDPDEEAPPDGTKRSALPAPIFENRKALWFAYTLARRRPDFASRSNEEQCRLLARACGHMTNILKAARQFAAFLEYGPPEGPTRPTREQANLDVRAAQLRYFEGYSEAEVGELLGIRGSSTDQVHGGNSTVSKMAERGKDILLKVMSEEEWSQGLDRGEERRRNRHGRET